MRPDAEILGIDLSASGVEVARKKVLGAQFFQQDFTQPMTIDSRYLGWATHAVCSEVLEHLDDPVATLRNTPTLLAPGGRFVLTVPGGPMSAFDKHIGHRSHFDRKRLESTIASSGFSSLGHGAPGFHFSIFIGLRWSPGKRLICDASGHGFRPPSP